MLPGFQPNVLRAFAADLEDRLHLRMKIAHHARDGFEFVLEVQAQNFGDRAAAGAGDADAFDARLRHHFVELVQQVVGGLDGAAGDAPVVGKHQRTAAGFGQPESRISRAQRRQDGAVLSPAQGGHFDTDSADIETKIDSHGDALMIGCQPA